MKLEDFIHDFRQCSLSPSERKTFDLHMDLRPMCRVHFTAYLRTIELGKRVCAADADDAATGIFVDLVSTILALRRTR